MVVISCFLKLSIPTYTKKALLIYSRALFLILNVIYFWFSTHFLAFTNASIQGVISSSLRSEG
jgi:hypothetical protein